MKVQFTAENESEIEFSDSLVSQITIVIKMSENRRKPYRNQKQQFIERKKSNIDTSLGRDSFDIIFVTLRCQHKRVLQEFL